MFKMSLRGLFIKCQDDEFILDVLANSYEIDTTLRVVSHVKNDNYVNKYLNDNDFEYAILKLHKMYKDMYI